ncbi:MAG: hypothetical protein R3F55_14280 [Alphaproteobacteria bacterium]
MAAGVRLAGVALASMAVLLAGCQSQPHAGAAPASPQAAEPEPDGALLRMRYRAAGPAVLSASTTVRAIVDGQETLRRDALSATVALTDAGEGLLQLTVDWRVEAAEVSAHLPARPFRLVALITDLGALRDRRWQFDPADAVTPERRAAIEASLLAYLPLIEWPEAPLAPTEVARRLAAAPLPADGERTFALLPTAAPGSRPAYLITASGTQIDGRGQTTGRILVDGQSGLPVALRFETRLLREVEGRILRIDLSTASALAL